MTGREIIAFTGRNAPADDAPAPPHNIEAVQALLAALMLKPHQLTEVVQWVQPEHFYYGDHQDVFACIQALVAQNVEPTGVNIKGYLREPMIAGEPSHAYLARIVQEALGWDAVGQARVVRDMATRRAMLAVGQDLIERVRFDPAVRGTEVEARIQARGATVPDAGAGFATGRCGAHANFRAHDHGGRKSRASPRARHLAPRRPPRSAGPLRLYARPCRSRRAPVLRRARLPRRRSQRRRRRAGQDRSRARGLAPRLGRCRWCCVEVSVSKKCGTHGSRIDSEHVTIDQSLTRFVVHILPLHEQMAAGQFKKLKVEWWLPRYRVTVVRRGWKLDTDLVFIASYQFVELQPERHASRWTEPLFDSRHVIDVLGTREPMPITETVLQAFTDRVAGINKTERARRKREARPLEGG